MTITTNAPAEARRMRAAADYADEAALQVVQDYGLNLQTRVRANMSGRSGVFYTPASRFEGDEGEEGEVGPRFQSGDLRRSVTNPVVYVTPRLIGVYIGSNEPQVQRLELGFVGVDAAGRHYDQPPYPAWRPALADLAEPFKQDLGAATAKALRG